MLDETKYILSLPFILGGGLYNFSYFAIYGDTIYKTQELQYSTSPHHAILPQHCTS